MGRCLGNRSLQEELSGPRRPLAVGRPLILRPATVGSPSVGVPTTVDGVGGSKCCLLFLSIRDAPRTLKSPKKKKVPVPSSPQASFTAKTARLTSI